MRDGLLLQPSEGVTIWSLDNLHVLQVSRCDSEVLGKFSCKAENNLGQKEADITVSKPWFERKISEIMSEEERNSNNVRRNVENVETALPLVSSAANAVNIVSLSSLCVLLSLLW